MSTLGRLSVALRAALRNCLEAPGTDLDPNTEKALRARHLIDSNNDLTTEGWCTAVVSAPLKQQCRHLNIEYERIAGLPTNMPPERAAWQHRLSQGYVGSYCEGTALLCLIRAAALNILAELNTFGFRADACTRYTEAQLTIHKDHNVQILAAIAGASRTTVESAAHEILPLIHDDRAAEGLTVDILTVLFDSLGTNRLVDITRAIMEDPYQYRAGWPDLTLTRDGSLLWNEIKTTDKLHYSQMRLLHRMKALLPGEIRVTQLRNV